MERMTQQRVNIYQNGYSETKTYVTNVNKLQTNIEREERERGERHIREEQERSKK
jgi:hypothetical protein